GAALSISAALMSPPAALRSRREMPALPRGTAPMPARAGAARDSGCRAERSARRECVRRAAGPPRRGPSRRRASAGRAPAPSATVPAHGCRCCAPSPRCGARSRAGPCGSGPRTSASARVCRPARTRRRTPVGTPRGRDPTRRGSGRAAAFPRLPSACRARGGCGRARSPRAAPATRPAPDGVPHMRWPRRTPARSPAGRSARGRAHRPRPRGRSPTRRTRTLLQGFAAVPPLVSDINLSLDDRYLYVSCWGTGELRQYDVTDRFNPVFTGSARIGGIVRRTAHPRNPEKALNGGPQMVEVSRDGRRVYITNSLYSPWDAQFYPDGIRGWVAKLDVLPGGGIAFDERFLLELEEGYRSHQVRLAGGDSSS